MTTPTQAQIEALTECAEDLEVEINSRYKDSAGDVHPALTHKYERDMRSVKNAREAIAALTAAVAYSEQWPVGTVAAGVPEQEHILQKSGQKPGLLPNGNTAEVEKTMVFCSAEYDAAVEARKKAESTYEVTPQFHLATKRLVNATIERCAGVAESYANDAFHGEMIAAEIRALKK